MDLFKIAGRTYRVKVIEIEESFEIEQSDNAGRTLGAGHPDILDPIGTKFSHKVLIARDKATLSEFDSLYDFVTTPRYDGVEVEIIHNQTTIKYLAKFSTGSRKTTKVNLEQEIVYWETFTLNIIPMKAQVLPL